MSYYYKNGTNLKYALLGECEIFSGSKCLKGVVYLRDGKFYVRLTDDFHANFEEE